MAEVTAGRSDAAGCRVATSRLTRRGLAQIRADRVRGNWVARQRCSRKFEVCWMDDWAGAEGADEERCSDGCHHQQREPAYELPAPLSTARPISATLARHLCQRGGVDVAVAAPSGNRGLVHTH